MSEVTDKRTWSSLITLFALVGLVLVGCKSGGQTVPDSQPLAAGQDFSGVWYSEQFEHMHLKQSGSRVVGIYTYKNGGRIEGTADGNVLRFQWSEPGDREAAVRAQSGKGYFQLVTEGEQTLLEGEWGYNDSRTGGGPWEAEYIRQLEPEDPMTLEDLERVR
ncbi:MAG: hypothetical protein ACQEVA_12230 [Myxococcota bacterium]